jgi:ketosteroid isomerase-like protein
MSSQSVDIARAAFAVWQARGIASLFDFLAADIEWESDRTSRTPGATRDTKAFAGCGLASTR